MLQKIIALPDTQKTISPAEAPEHFQNIIIEQLCRNEMLRQNKPVVILMCGSTASGKTKFTENACDYLSEQKLSTIFFSTDNYYKGVTRMVFDPIIAHLPVNERNEIINSIRGIIQDKPLAQKGSPKNCTIISFILQQYNIIVAPTEIAGRFENLNFDDPNAVDIPLLAEHLSLAMRKEPFDIPQYSMKLSEPVPSEKRFTGKEQVLMIEGINAFDERLLPWATTRVFVDVPQSNLFVRRIWRDIFKHPTNFTAEQLSHYLLTKALPAYLHDILPTKKYADIIINNPLTLSESANTQIKEYQAKVIITPEEATRLSLLLEKNATAKTLRQKDYFLHMPNYDKGYLRLREEATDGNHNHLATLMYIGQKIGGLDKGILYNPADILVNEKDFANSAVYAQAEDILQDFAAVGIKLLCQHEKIRKIYRYNKALHVDLDLIEEGQCILSLKVKQTRLKDIPAEYKSVGDYFQKICQDLLGADRAFEFLDDFDPSSCLG